MNKIVIFVAIFGFLAIQHVECRTTKVRTAAGETPAEGDITKAVVQKTEEIVKSADEFLNKGPLTSEQIIAKVKESGQNLVDSVKNFNEFLSKTVKDNEGSINTALKTIHDNLKASRESFEKNVLGPDGQKKAQEYNEQLHKFIKDSATQVGKLGDSLKPEAEKLKSEILAKANVLLDNVEKVASDVKASVEKSQKSKQ